MQIIFINESLLVINKYAGVVVHPADSYKGETLLDQLHKKFPAAQIVHRLDKDTTGLLLVALNEESAIELKRQFKEKEVKKVYLALTERVIKADSGEISAPIKRSKKHRTKMSISYDGRKSLTRFVVKKRFKNMTYVEIYPLSGRTHQIRVHFAYYGHPLIGDRKYAEKSIIQAPRQMLHAAQISFVEPISKKRLYFEAPLPDDFKKVLAAN